MTGKQWYAIYTRPKSEKKVASTLTYKGIETYCPTQFSRKQWHDRVKIIEEPIFRSYVFVHIKTADMVAVLSDNNVVNFVQHCGKPATIRDHEIDTIRTFLQVHTDCSIMLTEAGENDQVRIEEGLFVDFTGVVISKSKHKAIVRLELLNAYLVAEFKDNQYSKLN